MTSPSFRRRAAASGALCGVALVSLTLTACSSLPGSLPRISWPFSAKPTPAPVAVDELSFSGPAAQAFPQYWKRNTLVLDMQSASATGSTTFSPQTPAGWPVRLALRVRPGAFAAVEVEGDQRVVLPINATASSPLDLELDPAVYRRDTPAITVRWGAIAGSP